MRAASQFELSCLTIVLSMLLLGSLSTLPGCSKALNASEQRGKALYSFNCYECHEENQLGLLKTPPKLHRLFSHHYLPDGTTLATDESVRQIIIYGRRTMPAFNGRLSNDQVDDIIAYLHRK
ncbi:c-type cytochrome [Telmatobacter bradus]|jgi:mono/diheme cytochrome c family protein|uniref:c-type cytochrome n=1 Tax=Telmatobacter bradus TaxID=474953 RepID=UPI003B43AEE3